MFLFHNYVDETVVNVGQIVNDIPMTHEEMRITIAEACPEIFRWNGTSLRVEWIDTDEETCPLNDLNAMHEAEKTLSTSQQSDFLRTLAELTGNIDAWLSVHATAPQRAEAFCRTLWPE